MAQTQRRGNFRGKVSFNAAQQRNKASNYGHLMLPRNVSVFKEEGDTRILLDIIPYVVTDPNHPDRNDEHELARKGDMWYRRPYKMHHNVGAENARVVCPASAGRKCPICEYRTKLLSDGANWQDETIKNLRARNRNLYYVVPKGDKKLDEKPHIWDISQFAFEDKLIAEIEENEEREVFPSPQDGMTLRIRFAETKLGANSFAETSRIDFEKRDYVYDDEVIDALPSLDDVLVVKDYKEVSRLFFEAGDEDEEDGDADAAGADADAERRPKTAVAPLTRPKAGSNGDARSEAAEEPEKPKQAFTRQAPKPAQEAAVEKPPLDTEQDERAARRAARAAKEAKSGDRCPSGHTFGKDADDFPECEDCKLWGECMDAREAAEA